MSNWISTKERLPDKEGDYLTAWRYADDLVGYAVLSFGEIGKKKKRRMAFYDYNDDFNRREHEVDAWMEFEPYREGAT